MNDYLCLYEYTCNGIIVDVISEWRGSKVQQNIEITFVRSFDRWCYLIYREMCFRLCEYKRTTRFMSGDTYLTRQHDTYRMAE